VPVKVADKLVSSISSSPEPTVPKKIYHNLDTCKKKILSDNKNKSGIYMFQNLTNGKRYIGSSVDLYFRLSFYFSAKAMENSLKNNKSLIYNAILKHGHSNFSLTIIEYCEPEKLLIREKYYIDLGAEYNIVQDPTLPPMSGRTHSEETKQILSEVERRESSQLWSNS